MKKKLWKDEEKRDSVYRDLAPINSIKPEEESIRALRWAIKNPNVHNIALSGPFGSGVYNPFKIIRDFENFS